MGRGGCRICDEKRANVSVKYDGAEEGKKA